MGSDKDGSGDKKMKLSMKDVPTSGKAANRESAEKEATENVVKRNGNRRRRKNRDRSMILRVTDEEHEKITRVADALGYTYTDTFLMGIDELEKKLRGDF